MKKDSFMIQLNWNTYVIERIVATELICTEQNEWFGIELVVILRMINYNNILYDILYVL